MISRFLLIFVSLVSLAACTTNPQVAHRPARINHVVLVDLADAAEAPSLVADADRTLQRIPSVASYYCGLPYESGRANVSTDYTVGMYMGFLTPEDYQAYLVHPAHVDFVERWKPHCNRLTIYDVLDDSP
jgi:hypothetical protein